MKIKIIPLVLLISSVVSIAPCLADSFDEKDKATAEADRIRADAEATRSDAQANSKTAEAIKAEAAANNKIAEAIKQRTDEINAQVKIDRLEAEIDRLRATNPNSWTLHCAEMRKDMAERRKEVDADQKAAREYYAHWRENQESKNSGKNQ